MAKRVKNLFQACIANGHHPAPFKVAEVVMIPKTGRSARVRFESILAETKPLSCGLPQGSPAPPILYMLYTEPICCQLGTRRRRFGYADEIAMLRIGRMLQETDGTMGGRGTVEAHQMGSGERSEFRPGQDRNHAILEETEQRQAYGDARCCREDSEGRHAMAGNLLEQKPQFQRARQGMDRQAKPGRHPPTRPVQHGSRAPSRLERTGRNGLVWATRAKAENSNEGDPASLLEIQARKGPTRLQRCYQLVPALERPQLTRPSFIKAPRRSDKDREEKPFRAWLAESDEQTDLTVYLDGSQIKENGLACTGWGYSIRKGGTTNKIYRRKGRLYQAEVVDAEVHKALQDLAAAKAIGRHKRIHVSRQHISGRWLERTPPESSQSVFLRFKELAATHSPGVIVKWIPGHRDIEGNETADKLAKDGAIMEAASQTLPAVAWTRRQLRKQTKDSFA
ncbi:hypothetical protein SUNI508_13809 [Seiridium unicorne]|uniref:RNase H type-1 domain-containing protein n=1 Tax=Seiridium unicorne TaxID=138068 RepID=A0ABR2VAX1_9PEZI